MDASGEDSEDEVSIAQRGTVRRPRESLERYPMGVGRRPRGRSPGTSAGRGEKTIYKINVVERRAKSTRYWGPDAWIKWRANSVERRCPERGTESQTLGTRHRMRVHERLINRGRYDCLGSREEDGSRRKSAQLLLMANEKNPFL